MSDFFDRLEDQLVAKSRALSGLRPAPVRRRRFRARHLALAFALLAVGGSALAGSQPWEPLLGKPGHGPQATLSQASPPASELGVLGVLRRATTEADHGVATATALAFVGPGARDVRTRFIRQLTPGAGERPAVLVPAWRYDRNQPGVRIPAIADALCVVVLNSTSHAGAKGCYSAAQVTAGSAFSAAAHYVFGLVPDGVASVTFRYRSSPPASARVKDNFFEMVGRGVPHEIVWRDAAGRQIRSFPEAG